MILRLNLHIEAHWGHRPTISIRRAPRVGDITPDGILHLCPLCESGHLALTMSRHPSISEPGDDS